MDLEMEKTVVQLLSSAKAIEIKAFAVEGTIKETVHWCSQHTDYIRISRQNNYYSDAQRMKILDLDEVRNDLARINILKNTEYQPKNYNISFNYMKNPSLKNRIEKAQGEIRLSYIIPLTPQNGRLVYDYTDESWILTASKNRQSNCTGGRKVQSRLGFLDWTLSLSEVSLTLNLETNEISLDGTKLHCQIFQMLQFDAYMVKDKDRFWIETNTDWTLVQKLNEHNKNKTTPKNYSQIATRFEVYSKPEFYCGSTKPLYPTEYEDIFIIYEHGFDMNTRKPYDTDIKTFDNEKFIKINSKDISQQLNKTKNHDNYYYNGFVNEITHLEMQMGLYMSKIYSQLSLQAIEFYSKLCEQTRIIRQPALTQVHKDTPLLGYIITRDCSIFVQEEGIKAMKMYRCAKKVSQLKFHNQMIKLVTTKYPSCIKELYNTYTN